MSEGLNKWNGLGNLCEDATLHSGNTSVLKFRLACNERYKDRDGNWKDRAEYVPIVMFGKRAEALANMLRKGSRIFVEGGLRTSSYEAKDGSGKRYRTEIIASNIILCGGKSEGGSRKPASDAGSPTGGGAYSDADYSPDGDDDDIPFALADYSMNGERWWRW
jgi:single-strand DNA-binding protein